MAKHEKQHYVPKVYVRKFSPDHRSICIWNIRRKRKILQANLANQCYARYFYRENLEMETTLGHLESMTNAALLRLTGEEVPPERGSLDHFFIMLFVLTQLGRTKAAEHSLRESITKMNAHLGPDPGEFAMDPDEFAEAHGNLPQFGVQTMLSAVLFPTDLRYKLMINGTDNKFVTSDTPVVLYNQLFYFERRFSNTDFRTRGYRYFGL